MKMFLRCCGLLLSGGVLLSAVAGCATKREEYVRKHCLTGEEKRAILEGKLYIGMPKEAVIASIGRPARINADFLGRQVIWYYDYDRNLSTRYNGGIFKTTFIVELVDDKVYNWRED